MLAFTAIIGMSSCCVSAASIAQRRNRVERENMEALRKALAERLASRGWTPEGPSRVDCIPESPGGSPRESGHVLCAQLGCRFVSVTSDAATQAGLFVDQSVGTGGCTPNRPGYFFARAPEGKLVMLVPEDDYAENEEPVTECGCEDVGGVTPLPPQSWVRRYSVPAASVADVIVERLPYRARSYPSRQSTCSGPARP